MTIHSDYTVYCTGGPPQGCPADSPWLTSYIACRWPVDDRWHIRGHQQQIPSSDFRLRATGGPPVVYLLLIATDGPQDHLTLVRVTMGGSIRITSARSIHV